MKKTARIFIVLFIILGVILPGFCVFDGVMQEERAYDFCREVAEMNEKTKHTEYAFSENAMGIVDSSVYRLIVKTDENISGLAVDRAIGDTYSLFEYENEEDMLYEMSEFEKKGYMLQQDSISQAASVNDIANDVYFDEYRAMCTDEIKSSYALKYDNSDEIVVGVIDSGIYVNHSVFTNRIVNNTVNLSTSGEKNSIIDDNGHGTSVASIIVLSTPENVKVKGYKILDSSGHCYSSAIVSVLDYIANEKYKPDIINLSLCGYDLDSSNSITYDALRKVISKGVTVCAAAGNDNIQAKFGNVCGCQEVISVASCDITGNNSTFSNYGKDYIDLTAVGENVYSADIGSDSFSRKNGTSFSCPFVSAACAYVLMDNPSFAPADVEAYLKNNVCYRDDEENYGKGILNFCNLMEGNSDAVAVPSLKAGAYNEENLTLEFDVPAGYELYYGLNSLRPNLQYFSPITISENTVVNYALKKSGEHFERVESAAYEINYIATGKDAAIKNGCLIKWENNKTNVNVIIPESLSYQKITSIGANVFENSKLGKIYLSDSITSIESAAFKNSTIEYIEAKGVTVLVGREHFYGCTRLKKEVMPNLAKVAPHSFFHCSSLHKVDFDAALTNLGSSCFAYSGLVEADFPNIYNSSYIPNRAFESSTLINCSMPNLTRIGDFMFKNAKFLCKLDVSSALTLGTQAFYATSNLNNVSLNHIKTFYKGALTGCYIKNIYLPKVEQVNESLTTYSNNLGCKYVMCKTLDMPALKKLEAGSINISTVEEIYLKSAKSIMKNAICNAAGLKICVFSQASTVILPAFTSGEGESESMKSLCAYPSADIIYAPRAYLRGEIAECGVLYSGGDEEVTLTSGKKKLTVITNNSCFGYRTFIQAPSAFYRANIVYTVPGSEATGTNVFQYDKIKFYKIEDGNLIYKLGALYKFSIPANAAQKIFSSDDLNLREDSVRKCLLDINKDSIINAKDFAIMHRNATKS